MPFRKLVLILTSAMLLTASCADAGDTTATPEQSPTPARQPTVTASPTPRNTAPATEPQSPSPTATADTAREWTSCEHPEGLTIEYPAGWHVNDGQTLPACSAFHPEAFDVPEAQEFFDVAVLLSVEPVEFSRAASPEAQLGEVLDRREQNVDGHDAVRVETESDGRGLHAAGVQSTQWIVEAGAESTAIVSTHDVAGLDYERNQEILDEMVDRLEMPS